MFGLYHGGLGSCFSERPIPVKDEKEAESTQIELISDTIEAFTEGNWVNALMPLFFLREYDKNLLFDDIVNDIDKLSFASTISYLVNNPDTTLMSLIWESDEISRISARLPIDIAMALKVAGDKSKVLEIRVIEYILNNLAVPNSLAKKGNNYAVVTVQGLLFFKNNKFTYNKNKYTPPAGQAGETTMVDFKIKSSIKNLMETYAAKNNLKISDIVKNALLP